ncbi:MAG TPA: cell division protein FtsQ/DivIB [Solirubrobacterales bacterium]|jgi:cell division septal protein FtsQ|nr:cell division protein FtsQ/DivIB [Solirubrobacterales bacterium]
MRRWQAGLALLAAIAGAVYFFGLRERSVVAQVRSPRAAATIGGGSEAVVVSSTGRVIRWLPPPEEPPPPTLPLTEAPKAGRLAGPALQQARVLGAVPAALRTYLERSYYGDSGVDVVLTSGIELRFGDASQAARKWRAAAAVLADPSITALDYVDLQAPNRPSVGGSSHLLPAAP